MKNTTRVLALVLAVVMMLSLAACGSKTETPAATTGNSAAVEAPATPATPAEGENILRFALAQDIETLDAQQNTAEFTQSVAEGVTATLLREDNGVYSCDLAESYETEDYINWTFKIRQNAAWSDGTPITAHDFEYSWKQIFHRDECGKVHMLFDGIVGYDAIAAAMKEGKTGDELTAVIEENFAIDAVDEHTFTIQLENARPWILSTFSSPYTGPIKKDIYEANGSAYGSAVDKFAYCGAFYVSDWAYNEKVTLAPNPYYWNAENVKLDGVEILIVKDVEPRVNMFKEGKIMFARATSEYYETMANDSVAFEGSSWSYILTNQFRVDAEGKTVNEEISKLLANRDFIMALSYAIDRETLYSAVITDPTKFPTNLIVSGHLPLNDGKGTLVEEARAGRTFNNPISLTADETIAKDYLKKAMDALGYTDVSQIPTITLVYGQGAESQTICEFIKLSVEQYLGVKLEVEPVEFGVRDSRIISGDYDLLIMGWGIDGVDGAELFDPWYSDLFATAWGTGHPDQYKTFCDMMDQMNATTDFEERAELLLDIEEYLVQYGPFITLNWSGDCGLMNKNLKDFFIRETGATYNYVYASVG